MYNNDDIEMSLKVRQEKLAEKILDGAKQERLENAAHAKLVIIESPFAGDIQLNVAYARAAMRDSIMRGENPYASHLLFTQPDILNDDDPHERSLGMALGFAWGMRAELTAVYADLGITEGMKEGMRAAEAVGRKVIARSLGTKWKGLIV